MESERANDVMASNVAISVSSDETQEQTQPADPQSNGYYIVMYYIAFAMVVILCFAPDIIHNKSQSPFKAHGGLFMFMAIAGASMAVLVFGILIFASFFLQSWMKNIHYAVLEIVGIFCGFLSLYSEIAVICVPRNLNCWVYVVISITAVLFLAVCYYFLWKLVQCRYQHKVVYEIEDWSFYLSVLIAILLLASQQYLPPMLDWAKLPLICIGYFILFYYLVRAVIDSLRVETTT